MTEATENYSELYPYAFKHFPSSFSKLAEKGEDAHVVIVELNTVAKQLQKDALTIEDARQILSDWGSSKGVTNSINGKYLEKEPVDLLEIGEKLGDLVDKAKDVYNEDKGIGAADNYIAAIEAARYMQKGGAPEEAISKAAHEILHANERSVDQTPPK